MTQATATSGASAGSSEFTVRDAVYALMREFGTNKIFGNPGSTELPMFRHFPDDFEYVLGLQEATVVGMADGYAQATGNASFVNLHAAAGVGNAMGNLYSAFKNQTPMVVIAGQQSRSILPFDPYLGSSQATELPKPYVKYSIQPARAADVPLAVARAYYTAMQAPRGPVLVSVPVDDWDRPAQPLAVRAVSTRVAPDPDALRVIADALNAAQRPAFVVGASVDRDDAWPQMLRLTESHSAAVYVAPFAARCSFPEDHPLFRGFLPASRERIVAQLAAHDFILVIGAPAFIYHTEGQGPFIPPSARLYQLTEDPDTASWAPVGTAAVGSIRLALCGLQEQASPAARKPPPALAAVAPVPATRPMSAAYVLQTIAQVRAPDDIIVEEAPSSRIAMHSHLPIVRPQTFYTMASGGLGYGMPAAVGVAMGRPDKRVICVVGDGSALYSPQALWSAARQNLDITFIVINNAGYAAMKRFAGVFGFPADEPIQGIKLPGLDFMALAHAHGCPAVQVASPDDLAGVIRQGLDTRGPMLIEAIVESGV
ncbi:benzoylformate decarboxylase [Candidimonas nitroreducens]|uniref:Benzoylformate decarboxylase n=1 Tax=Candidimonas nitroreducens TaxID=683354 RepID=A0A225MGE3_9BURK|nr:benzoylformate decarboxylase [Candidimonas nitroreducens]OWT60417.1 benzoylformate decarboxylase [Candidimonas nitroreducens]